jgi:hypothetical protein
VNDLPLLVAAFVPFFFSIAHWEHGLDDLPRNAGWFVALTILFGGLL